MCVHLQNGAVKQRGGNKKTTSTIVAQNPSNYKLLQVRVEQATTGPRVTTPRELNWLTLYWIASARRQRVVTVSRVSS